MPEKLPRHIAVIADGNGRWAVKRLMPRPLGHRQGVKTLEKIIDAVADIGIPYFTFYAFSTENQKRDSAEIDGLIKLIRQYFSKSIHKFIEKDIRVRVVGDTSYFQNEVREVLSAAEEQTAGCKRMTVAFALNYGGRDEILRAVNRAVAAGESVNGERFSNLLDTAGMPDPDMVIRTGGECRLSNFLLFQSAYAELFFIPDLWPDFTKAKLVGLLAEFAQRSRKFGK